eukprot:TRINITY_DN90605_c0_g1_i1.p1 TRINITY_DN90605_c0_g1~~TRINITY_DN90605_c0_g1_i1.p1  ORF type:complete len:278 (-),score=52.51 TRINITY_DN90605_c0_g1_i1:91-924(-)
MGATCAQCAPVEVLQGGGSSSSSLSSKGSQLGGSYVEQRLGCYTVQLAATPIGPAVPGLEKLQAYHTSVVVDSMEYSFGPKGVAVQPLRQHTSPSAPAGQAPCGGSHIALNGPREVLMLGLSGISGPDLGNALKPFFRKGTYDLLRKNCNSFTDCALFYLLGERLAEAYCGLERLGAVADSATGVVQAFSQGGYMPNPKADDFDVERAVQALEKEKCAASFRNLDQLRRCSSYSGPVSAWEAVNEEGQRARPVSKMPLVRQMPLQSMEQVAVEDGTY